MPDSPADDRAENAKSGKLVVLQFPRKTTDIVDPFAF
jgi:hypothetical protein